MWSEFKPVVVIVVGIAFGYAAAAGYDWVKSSASANSAKPAAEKRVDAVEERREAARRVASPRAGEFFRGSEYRCTQDCSGHDAGYKWAGRNGLRSRDQCTGNSDSFIEGCWAFVEGR